MANVQTREKLKANVVVAQFRTQHPFLPLLPLLAAV